MKLGLKIEITSQGAGSAAKTYNSTPALEKYASASRSFIKEVFPAREDLKLKGIDPSTSLDESARSVVFLRFLGPEGYLICVFQARPENSGRPYDGAAAWIHLPTSVMLSGIDTVKLIDEVDAAMSEERGINYTKLDALFTKEYEQKNVLSVLSTIGSNGPTAGIRYYGVGTDFELSELLGNNIVQQNYSNYKAVFLLRKNDNIAVSVPEISTPLSQTCIVSAPSPVAGYNAFFENGMPFNVDLEYPLNAPLTIVWKKAGYQDIVKKANAKGGNAKETAKLFEMNKSEIKVAIMKQIFVVFGDRRILTNYQISLDGEILKDVLYISEEKLARGIRVKVVADGFKTYAKDHKFDLDSKQIEIQLKRQSFIYEFAIPMYSDGERINDGLLSIELNTKLEDCPIEGYSLTRDYILEGEGNVNRIERSGTKDAIKHFAYGFLTCVGIILAVLLYNFIEEIDQVKFKFGWPPIELVMYSSGGSTFGTGEITDNGRTTDNGGVTETEPVDNYSHERAIAYLNSNNIWCSDSIAKYPSLTGLFEALNDYKFDELVNKWSIELQDVPNFGSVVQAANIAISGKWNPRQNPHAPLYNKDNDNLISLKTYTNWISKDQTPKVAPVKQENPVNHIKSAAPVTKPATTPSVKNKKNRGKV